MEEIDPEEIKININELEGEPFDLNFNEVQEVDGEFQKQVINSPDEYSLNSEKTQKFVLEGFTEGAIKNILTLSTQKIRLYKVTESSIDLLSCTEFQDHIKSKDIRENAVLNKSLCSIQVSRRNLSKKT